MLISNHSPNPSVVATGPAAAPTRSSYPIVSNAGLGQVSTDRNGFLPFEAEALNDARGLTEVEPGLLDDLRVALATRPQPSDTPEAKELKADYSKLYNEVRDELTQARQLFEKLGPGHHCDQNQHITIRQAKDGGQVTVTVQRADGTKTTTSFDLAKPDDGRVTRTDSGGNETVMTKDGNRVSRQRGTESTSYHLDSENRPTRHRRQGVCDSEVTVVLPDGSTRAHSVAAQFEKVAS